MTTWWVRLLNRLGLRRDTLVCIRREDTWRWTKNLGAKTEGECGVCGGPIYYERQNSPFRKVCNRCVANGDA